MTSVSHPPITRRQPCDLCGGHRFEVVGQTDRRGDFLSTVVCRQCGLVSHGKIPSDAELDVYYGQHYRRDYHGETAPSPHRVIRAWKNGQRLLRRLAPLTSPSARVFEVGAGIGCTVKAFELAGYDARGIEPNDGFSTYSREQLRAPVRRGALDEVADDAAYDLVLLIHVIEHFNWPSRSLRKIRQLLKPGGRLYLECPNIVAPHAAPGKLFHFAHIYNFTPSTLTMLAGACGFAVERWFSAGRDKELQVLLRRVDEARLKLDPQSYAATMDALRRYNGFTYHVRPSYVVDRICRLATHWSEHVASRRRVGRIVARCAQPRPVSQEAHVDTPRKAA